MKVKKKNLTRYLKHLLNREMDLIFIVSNVKANWMGVLYTADYNMLTASFYYYMR